MHIIDIDQRSNKDLLTAHVQTNHQWVYVNQDRKSCIIQEFKAVRLI